jgi:anti-sigma B factor antagonist
MRNSAGCLAASCEDADRSQAVGTSNDVCQVRRTDQLTVVTLPGHIEESNAGRIREELLSVIGRGVGELIVDMTATLSCDYAGQDAVARACHRAVASGTQLRLAITAQIVRRGFRLSGLDQLIPVYPTVQAAAACAATTRAYLPGKDKIIAETRRRDDATGPVRATGQELLDQIATSLFRAGMNLEAALGIPEKSASQHITEALRSLEDTIGDIRSHLFAAHGEDTEVGAGFARGLADDRPPEHPSFG